MLIFFELLVPSTSSLSEMENYLCVSWSAPRDLFIYRLSIHGLSWVESYLKCSKYFLVITIFLCLTLCSTNYILVVHTLLCVIKQSLPLIWLFIEIAHDTHILYATDFVKRLLVQVTSTPPHQGTEHYGAMLNASERRRWYSWKPQVWHLPTMILCFDNCSAVAETGTAWMN